MTGFLKSIYIWGTSIFHKPNPTTLFIFLDILYHFGNLHKGYIQKKHSHCHLQQYNSLLHPNHYPMPWLLHQAMLMPFWGITPFSNRFWCSCLAYCRYFFDFRYFWGWSNMFLTWCGGCFINQSCMVLTWYCCSHAYSEESEESLSFSLSEVDSSSKSLIFLRSVSASSAV